MTPREIIIDAIADGRMTLRDLERVQLAAVHRAQPEWRPIHAAIREAEQDVADALQSYPDPTRLAAKLRHLAA